MNGKPLEEVTASSTWEPPCQKMAPAEQNPHPDRHGHSSDGQAEQGMQKQHQLQNQIPALQITGCLHPALRMRGMITFIQFFSKIETDLWSGGIFCRTKDTPKQNCKESIVKESNWSLLFQYTQIQILYRCRNDISLRTT